MSWVPEWGRLRRPDLAAFRLAMKTKSKDKPQLVLASTSSYRRALLERLNLEFVTDTPSVDETPIAGESAEQLVIRLAEAKARDVAARHPHALIIGSDQVACIDKAILGKPGSKTQAVRQLLSASGSCVRFVTGLCVWNSASNSGTTVCEPFTVHFRQLNESQIERYLDIEKPFDCAGSFKSEGLGISLFERLEGDDPNALIGLPLIRLVTLLNREGVSLP